MQNINTFILDVHIYDLHTHIYKNMQIVDIHVYQKCIDTFMTGIQLCFNRSCFCVR